MMKDYFAHLIDRAANRADVALPRQPSLFEPAPYLAGLFSAALPPGDFQGIDAEAISPASAQLPDPRSVTPSRSSNWSRPARTAERHALDAPTRDGEHWPPPVRDETSLRAEQASPAEAHREADARRPGTGPRRTEQPIELGLETIRAITPTEHDLGAMLTRLRETAGARPAQDETAPITPARLMQAPPTDRPPANPSAPALVAPAPEVSPDHTPARQTERLPSARARPAERLAPDVVPAPTAVTLPEPLVVQSAAPSIAAARHGAAVTSPQLPAAPRPTIQVTIGRIEVRANQSPPPARRAETGPRQTLDQYLSARSGRRR
jgi:hypothetical protein